MNSDFYSEASDVLILPSQTITGAVTGPAVDLQQFKGVVRGVLTIGAVSGTTPVLSAYVQSSIDTNTSNFTNTGIVFSNATVANANISVGIDTRLVSRYIRVITSTTGTTPSFGGAVVGVGVVANY